jgi:hypothetical protein
VQQYDGGYVCAEGKGVKQMGVRCQWQCGAGSSGSVDEVSCGCVCVMEGGIGYGRASFVTDEVIAAVSGGRLYSTERHVAMFVGIENGCGGRQTSGCVGLRVVLLGLRELCMAIWHVI